MPSSKLGATLSPTKDAALAILSWANEAADAFPPLKSAVGSVLYIAVLVDKFRTNKKDWQELGIFIAKEVSKLKDKMEGLDLSSPGKYAALEMKIDSLASELNSIKEDIQTLVLRPWHAQLAQALSDPGRIARFRERVQECEISSLVDAVFDILRGVTNLESRSITPHPPSTPDFSALVPEKPRIFHGREEELKSILSFIEVGVNANKPTRIGICGSGGLGKTSLALSVLHHDEMRALFGSHGYFVSCEATNTPSLLLSAINRALEITHGSSDPLVQLQGYLRSLNAPAMLILDNFETPWESEERDRMQQILALLDSSSNLTLLLTTRVTILPDDIIWAKFPPLRPFSLDAARHTFNDITRAEPHAMLSNELDKLLLELDLVPLAVKLMASAAQSGESIANLQRAWNRERTAMLAGETSGKNSNLEVSIKISLDSKTVQSNTGAIRLLSLLCLLPDGAERSSLDQITMIKCPDPAVRALKAASLIYEERARLRILSPIRAYILIRPDLQTHEDDLRAVIRNFINLASKGPEWVDDEGFIPACQILPPERGNIHSILSLAICKGPISSELAGVLKSYTWFLNATSPSPDLLKQLVEIQDWGEYVGEHLQVAIRCSLAEAYRKTGALDQSQEQLERAHQFCVREH